MKKLVLVAFLIAGSAAFASAQSAAGDPKNEFFAGYSFNSSDINTLTVDPDRTSQHGVNLAYTRYVTDNVGITADISAHFHREKQSIGTTELTRNRDQYYVLGGVQFKSHKSGAVKPFAHALLGISLFRGFTSDIRPSGNTFTFDDSTSFAMAFGGGLDVRLNKRIDLRIIQADYAPTFFGSGRQDNFRLSFGIVFKK